MARLELFNLPGERRVIVTLSRRNLLTLLHQLDMAGSMRQFENNDCYEDGAQTPWYPGEDANAPLARTTLVLRCENGDEHCAQRPAGPGVMHPATERYVRENGGALGEIFLDWRNDDAERR